MKKSQCVVGADVGGTFTDLVSVRDGQLHVRKVPSRPDVPGSGLRDGLQALLLDAERQAGVTILHGTTVGTNAFLERKVAPTSLITTAGFEDLLLVGRQTRERLYDLAQPPVVPLVPPSRVLGVAERVAADGTVLQSLAAAEVERAAGFVRDDSVAICLLFSFVHPGHERQLLAALPGACASHEVLPEYREFERCVATVLNASLAPIMQRYLNGLEASLSGHGVRRLWIMQSNGGLIAASDASRLAVRTLVSGPAAGVEGAFGVASRAGFRRIMTLDVGGTSSDVSLCSGSVSQTREARLGGLPLAFPMVDIQTVGAGGGSLVEVDAAGAIHVGPQSAGADPGPACYGRGDRPTVTDAHLVLGRLGEDDLLGGQMHVDARRSERALEPVAAAARCSVPEAAQGVVAVANANMEKALRIISVERGHDPRLFTLVAFGGAGPLHACELADALQMPRVLVPRYPGVLSAVGLLSAKGRRERSLTVALRGNSTTTSALEDVVNRLADGDRSRVVRWVDVRYPGQSYELSLSLPRLDPQAVADRFHRLHRQRYGYARPASDVEIVNVRVSLEQPGPAAGLDWKVAATAGRPQETRRVWDGAWRDVPVYRREATPPAFSGPAIVLQYDTTTYIPTGWNATVDPFGNLVLEHGT